MTLYEREPLPLDGAFLLHFPRYPDARGYFAELFRRTIAEAEGLPEFVQDNLSYSRGGVLRGLHFQRPPHAQAKLVCPLQGTIQDVIVDLRPSSPTYKRWHAVELRAEGPKFSWLYVPVGFAHGFLVLSKEALVLYRNSAYYAPDYEGGIRWDDPELAIAWQLQGPPILSPKDAALPTLAQLVNPFAQL